MKIAAGEVIEGPFSVVRELIDNAIDAGSTQVRVAITNGGRDFLQVIDNGTGMSEQDAKLAVLKHTTSKISRIDDLSSITSMGFRGEALASICVVSDFSMVTKGEEDEHGVRLHSVFGGEAATEPAASNQGTSVTVRNLFHNLPARKKFLKSNRSEAARVKDEVVKKAISFYQCGFTYKNDDRVIFSLEPRDDHLGRLMDLFGDRFGENLIETRHEDDLVTIHGYVSNSRLSLPNRSGQFLFINSRPVADRSLLFALNSPCRGIVRAGRYVYAFLFIRINPELLDINVHPAKKEVKIKPTDRLYSAVYHAVEKALQIGYYGISVSPDGSGSAVGYNPPPVSENAGYGYSPEEFGKTESDTAASGWTLLREDSAQGAPLTGLNVRGAEVRLDTLPFSEAEPSESRDWPLDIREGGLQYRGSIFNTFLIFESGRDVVLIDQHAAHERVYYEQFSRRYESGGAVKSLLVPINFTPPAGKYGDLADAIETFREAGIEIEPFGDESFNIVTLPAFIPENREEITISQLFDELYAGNLGLSAHEIRDGFIKLAACRSAVKEGDALSREEALALMSDLLAAEVPFVCPHGRPTMVRYSREYFDTLFKRR
jgi:DNA mismatch repair protein MutL